MYILHGSGLSCAGFGHQMLGMRYTIRINARDQRSFYRKRTHGIGDERSTEYIISNGRSSVWYSIQKTILQFSVVFH